jgi:protein farnesyltransferase/geranylgeranyltransferase type-1 subunit alpha
LIHGYFRAILQKEEYSERVLALTEEVIKANSANYTAWQYRRKCLKSLNSDLDTEMVYVNKSCEDNIKNYQVWYHRKAIIDQLRKVDGEMDFLSKVLEEDEKNYHVWAHRQWVAKEFKLYDNEFDYVAEMLKRDFRNNSVWNYRYFLVENTTDLSESVRESEIKYAFGFIGRSPNNESAWNYAKGMAFHHCISKQICQYLLRETQDLLKRASVNVFGNATLVKCHEVLGTKEDLKAAIDTCRSLETLDGIRARYWNFKSLEISKRL